MTTDFGVIVLRSDKDNRLPFEAGDEVVTYALGEPWPYGDLPPHVGAHVDLEEYQNAVMEHANEEKHWRLQADLKCECRDRRTIAQLLVHQPTGRLWASMKPERVPSQFRSEKSSMVKGWALHGRVGEAPHVGGISSCNGCRARWVVVSFTDRLEKVRVQEARHGARVVP